MKKLLFKNRNLTRLLKQKHNLQLYINEKSFPFFQDNLEVDFEERKQLMQELEELEEMRDQLQIKINKRSKK